MAVVKSRYRLNGGTATIVHHWARWVIALTTLMFGGIAVAASEGQPAPAMHAKLLDGSAFDVGADAGKVVIVNMWATWCAPCREEMPALDAFYQQHRDQGLVLVALSMDDPKDIAKVREVTKGFSFPVGFGYNADMKGYGRIWRLPLTFVVDRKGILRKDQWYGDPGLDVHLLDQTVTPLLQER